MLSNTGANKVILLGQIANQPLLKAWDGQKRFLYLDIVTTELIKMGTEMIEHNECHQVKVPEKLADNESLRLEIGQTIYVEGKLEANNGIDDQNVKRKNPEIIAVKIEILV